MRTSLINFRASPKLVATSNDSITDITRDAVVRGELWLLHANDLCLAPNYFVRRRCFSCSTLPLSYIENNHMVVISYQPFQTWWQRAAIKCLNEERSCFVNHFFFHFLAFLLSRHSTLNRVLVFPVYPSSPLSTENIPPLHFLKLISKVRDNVDCKGQKGRRAMGYIWLWAPG